MIFLWCSHAFLSFWVLFSAWHKVSGATFRRKNLQQIARSRKHYLKGYALCRRPPLLGRGLCGGGYLVLAGFTGCWLFWVLWFPVKCAETSWLLEVGFYCLSSYSCHFGREFSYFGCPKPIIWYVCWLHFTTLEPFCQLGDTLGDHGSSRKHTWGSETRFSLISGWFLDPILRAFWGSMG